MSNRQPKKKTGGFEFPLPLYENKYKKKPIAIPGLDPVSPPGKKIPKSEKKEKWSEIVERAKKDLAPWLSKSWWAYDEKFVCQNSNFRRAVREALTISIAIPEREALSNTDTAQWMNNIASEWSQRLFNQDPPPNDWAYRIGPGQCVFEPKGLNKELICRVAEFLPVQSRSINGPLSRGEFGLAFPKGMLSATNPSPKLRFMIADFLKKLADEIKPKKKPPSEDRRSKYIHQQAIEALAFSWWVKRGGSNKRFYELADRLFGLQYCEEIYKQTRRRFTPDLFWSIAFIGHSVNNKRDFLSLLTKTNMKNRAQP